MEAWHVRLNNMMPWMKEDIAKFKIAIHAKDNNMLAISSARFDLSKTSTNREGCVAPAGGRGSAS